MNRKNRTVIGLVGGIGSGKSTVARILEGLGAAVIDADRMVSECLRRPAVLSAIRKVFGAEVFDDRGAVDRRRLADLVFSGESQRRKINGIIHPVVLEKIREELDDLEVCGGTEVVVIDAPLLIESGLEAACDQVVLVRAPLDARIERTAAQRGWSGGEVARRESFQAPLAVKEAAAGAVIENDGTMEELKRRVAAFHAGLTKKRKRNATGRPLGGAPKTRGRIIETKED